MELVEKRRPGVEYFVEHHRGNLFLLTNAQIQHTQRCSSDYRLFLCPVGALRLDNWKQIVLEEHDAIIYDMDIFEKHLVLYQRNGGLPQISVLDLPFSIDLSKKRLDTLHPYILPLPKGACSVTPGLNQDYNSSTLRLSISSPIMPEALVDYDMSSKEFTVLQQDKVVATGVASRADDNSNSGKIQMQENMGAQESMDKEECKTASCESGQCLSNLSAFYACEHLKVPSVDMVEIPLTLTYSRKLKVKGRNPALVIAYGAYGEILDLKWCSDYLSLLDRGWVLAFAHVRGGGELGKSWHHSGRVLQKLNSMQDFLACADFLIKSGYAHEDRVAAKGVSAGGLLVAAATNMRPSLFHAVILKVPFIDIGNTMLDESLALTVSDYEEWGNPDNKEIFEYIHSYSPYDNVKKMTPYPAMLVLSSFLDTRVGYWEAAKWVARVREYTNGLGDCPVLLKTGMSSGHFSESGRYLHIMDTAFEYAFLIKMVDTDTMTEHSAIHETK